MLILENPALHGGPGDQHAVRRHSDVLPAVARARTCRPPYASCSTKRLYGGQRREGLHVARRLRDHGELGAARPRQPVQKPMLWLDVLDFPAVNFFEAVLRGLFQRRTRCRTTRGDGDSAAFYASGVLPDSAPIRLNRSPVINCTLCRTGDPRPIEESRRDRQEPRRACATPTRSMAARRDHGRQPALFPKGFRRALPCDRQHHLVCTEGAGVTRSRTRCSNGANDVFVVPPWKRYSHHPQERDRCCSRSDRPAQEALGI